MSHAVYTLHRYFICVSRLRLYLSNTVDEVGAKPPKDGKGRRYWLLRVFTHLTYWLASLYVVVEGWRELNLTDERIDNLLRSDNVERIRRVRNGVFHFQPDYFDKRFVEPFKHAGISEWADSLNQEFGRYFADWFHAQGIDPEIEIEQVGDDEEVVPSESALVSEWLTRICAQREGNGRP